MRHSKWQGNWKRSHAQFISRKNKQVYHFQKKRNAHGWLCKHCRRFCTERWLGETFLVALGSWTCVSIVLNQTLNQPNYIPTSVLLCNCGGVAVAAAPYIRIWKRAVLFLQFMNGEQDSSVVKCQISDQKVLGLSPGRSGGRIFYFMVNFLRSLLFWGLFHPCVTVVAGKRFGSFCQKCRGQVTAKHMHPNYVTSNKTVNWCMVVWCTQNMHWKGSSFSSASHVITKQRC